ncbi:MAG: hypothetical protein P8L37_03655, partial [Phycisphaerales bacterium]|nr:hypothetical protein [Phycisphaerales bacterium]
MNAKNVLFCVSSQPEWIATASQLLERQKWTPTYWITRVENHAAVESVFGDATLHRRLDLNRGLDASGSEMNSWRSVSQEFFQEGQFYISTAMEMMDRIDLGQSFRNQERKRLAVNMLSHAFD